MKTNTNKTSKWTYVGMAFDVVVILSMLIDNDFFNKLFKFVKPIYNLYMTGATVVLGFVTLVILLLGKTLEDKMIHDFIKNKDDIKKLASKHSVTTYISYALNTILVCVAVYYNELYIGYITVICNVIGLFVAHYTRNLAKKIEKIFVQNIEKEINEEINKPFDDLEKEVND